MRVFVERGLVVLLGLIYYLGLPGFCVWNWIVWAKQKEPKSVFSILSLVGLVFGTASMLLAVGSITYARYIGSFGFYDPLLLKIYRWGAVLSFSAILFATAGVWRRHSIRWRSFLFGVGMLFFWGITVNGE